MVSSRFKLWSPLCWTLSLLNGPSLIPVTLRCPRAEFSLASHHLLIWGEPLSQTPKRHLHSLALSSHSRISFSMCPISRQTWPHAHSGRCFSRPLCTVFPRPQSLLWYLFSKLHILNISAYVSSWSLRVPRQMLPPFQICMVHSLSFPHSGFSYIVVCVFLLSLL